MVIAPWPSDRGPALIYDWCGSSVTAGRQPAFPGRDVVGVHGSIEAYGGGVHCSTQHIPVPSFDTGQPTTMACPPRPPARVMGVIKDQLALKIGLRSRFSMALPL
jgi:hypothetical protein